MKKNILRAVVVLFFVSLMTSAVYSDEYVTTFTKKLPGGKFGVYATNNLNKTLKIVKIRVYDAVNIVKTNVGTHPLKIFLWSKAMKQEPTLVYTVEIKNPKKASSFKYLFTYNRR